jgi:microcystin-dependent protein
MPEFAPLFEGATLPKNTTPLTERLVTNELINDTVGAAAGANTATVNKARVPHTTDTFNGKKTAETVVAINRVTTAADVAALKTKLTRKKPSFGYVRDLSGNGGPAFTRT